MTELTREIPDYLRPYIVEQDASLYTPIDHAVWRFILRISKAFFGDHAASKYLSGLEETGISSDRIPLISEMDAKLSRFGWRAVAVSGFIPPAVFMEFLSLGILPIACDMRSLEHLAYTPAPDIVHEAAGHAPMIADSEYEAYLRAYGEISRKAITSDQDMQVYLAIRKLSDVKEHPSSTPAEIAEAQRQLDEALARVTYVSEAAQLARMNWWTIEYGLVGPLENPKIYGAGLLSSVGESYRCLGPEVRKLPFSLACVDMSYDITRPQPQLYVTQDFATLTRELERLADTMAFRRGGHEGLERARIASTPTTAELDSRLQIAGLLAEVLVDDADVPVYLQYQGPTQLAFQDRELAGQGPDAHREGFGAPLGAVALASGALKSPAALSAEDIRSFGFAGGKPGRLRFASGVTLEGVLDRVTPFPDGRGNALLTFRDCRVTLGNRTLFEPAWGVYDMACGQSVVSVYGGAADRRSYLAATGGFHPPPNRPPGTHQGTQKTNLTNQNRELAALYGRIREIREAGAFTAADGQALAEIYAELERRYPEDWLARFELLELAPRVSPRPAWEPKARRQLDGVQTPEAAELVRRGLEALGV